MRARAARLGVLLCLVAPTPAAAQEPAPRDLPVSLDRIRAEIEKPEVHALDVDVPLALPVIRFEVTVEARPFMLSFEEQLRKDLAPQTLLAQQSRDWASRCCGIDLGLLFDPIGQALERRKLRKVHERIARELEALEAARATVIGKPR